MLTIHLFGVPQVSEDRENIRLNRRKSRALLYYLAAQPGPVTREQLMALFWLDLPRPAAQQTLRTTLYGLRKALETNLVIEDDRVGLAQDAWVDVREFDAQMESFETDPIQAHKTLELYQGDFLEGVSLVDVQPFEDWLIIEREHYRRLAVRGFSALASAYEGRGDYVAALECLQRALAFNPLQEDLQRESIRLLYLSGDRPGAIRRYDELRRLLDDEMGVPPMVETRALYDAIITDRLPTLARPVYRLAAPPPLDHQTASQVASRQAALPFTGRSAELQAVQSALDDGCLALVQGEAGIGKTRLAEEYLDTASALSIVGRGRELEQALPYHTIIEALSDVLVYPEWPVLLSKLSADLPAVWLAEVSRLLPELEAHLPDLRVLSQPADEARLWEGVRQFLLAVSRYHPLIIFLDDAHWVDASSLGLLGYLARHTQRGQIGFIATARPVERSVQRAGSQPSSAWPVFIQNMIREDRLVQINLERLDHTSVHQVAQQLSPTFAEPLAEWLWRMSEGNPYILVELVRYARQNQILVDRGVVNLSALSDSPVVPHTVYSLIQSRLGSLSDAARRVFDVAVAAGREFEFKVTARAAGLSEIAALDALDELQTNGLVTAHDETHFHIDHPLLMEVAYREVGELRHRLMHHRIAEAMESLHLDRQERAASQLAFHFSEGNDFRHAVRYAMIAGEQAIRLAAWSEAITYFQMALKGLPGEQGLDALLALGEAHAKAGHYAQASDTLRQALSLALAMPDSAVDTGAIRLALARSLLPQARFTEVIGLAQDICSAASPNKRVMAELFWGTALAIEGLYLADAENHLRTAQELWQAGERDDLSLIAQIHFELGNVAAQRGDLAYAVACYRESLRVASENPHEAAVEQRILALNNLAYHLHLSGDPTAVEYAREGLKLAQEKGILGYQTYLYSTLGEIALDTGHLEQAEEYFNNGLALAERLSMAERTAGLKANLGRLAARQGKLTLAIHQLSTALGLADALGTLHLAARIRIWLAPLLPPAEAHQRLLEARRIAESGGRSRLLAVVAEIEAQLVDEGKDGSAALFDPMAAA